jgi:hypothetical protein
MPGVGLCHIEWGCVMREACVAGGDLATRHALWTPFWTSFSAFSKELGRLPQTVHLEQSSQLDVCLPQPHVRQENVG